VKRMQIFLMVSFLVLGLTSWAGAAASDPYTYQGQAEFWVVDNAIDSDTTVGLTILNYPLSASNLEYSTDGGQVWTSIDSSTTSLNIDTGSNGGKKLVAFQLEGTPPTTTATMTFGGLDGPGLYHSVALNFDYKYISLDTASGADHVSSVPLPAAAWLLCSGLLGLVGIRRKTLA
jgi:hypothetical protein